MSGTTASAPAATPTPTPTPVSTADAIALPGSCEQLYSAGMLQNLRASRTLDDPGITMYATQIVPALEILESGVPTLRCTWGIPGKAGFATQVSLIDGAQAATIRGALTANGFSCESLDAGTICRAQTRTVDMNDNVVTRGETHYLRGNGWVATSWVDDQPEGYTEDIVATLW